MPRLTIFAKGNSDVVESLFACRDGGGTWNGINEALRARRPDWRVRLRHETFTRSDALLAASGEVPDPLRHLAFEGFYGIESQFGAAFFEGGADASILSIQPDVTMTLLRHRASGHLFYPGYGHAAPADLRDWLRTTCEAVPPLTPEASLDNLVGIVARLRERSQAPILVYNLSTYVTGEAIDCFSGLDETLTTRIKRFNLMLVTLSERTGVILVDVDRIAARAGAERLKLDSVRLNCAGSRLVAEDVVRLLDGHDCFAARA